MKRGVNLYPRTLRASALSLSAYTVQKDAARFFDALYFWFFSFIFPLVPIRKKRIG